MHDELKAAVREALLKEQINPILPNQWADHLDESASDVLGILNMGPAVGISLIGYFRAMNASMGGPMKLWNMSLDIDYDNHPADGRKSADVVAETIMNYKLNSLEGHALSEIQNWGNIDEEIVKILRSALRS